MNKRLEKIIKHAYTQTPMYMNLAEEQNLNIQDSSIEDIWGSLPIINKELILKHPSSAISISHMALLINKKLVDARTSGSTGKCMEIYWTKEDLKRSLLSLWIYRKKQYDINPDDKYCYFYTTRTTGPVETESEVRDYAMGFSKCGLDKEKMKLFYEQMLEFQPVWMLLQPSLAILLQQCVEEYNLPKIESLRYIELSAEMLSKGTKHKLEEVLGCNISNQYGCNEANSIAYECKEGHLHCVNSNVYVEVMKDGKLAEDGEEGEIVITSLHNYAMPIIRYTVGDRGMIYHNSECACGNPNPILDLTVGRSNDWVLDRDGNRINTYIFVRAAENVNRVMEDAIKQFQIIQEDYDEFTIRLVLDDEDDAYDVEELFIENFIQPSLDGAVFNFEYHDALFPEENGKLLYFKSMIETK